MPKGLSKQLYHDFRVRHGAGLAQVLGVHEAVRVAGDAFQGRVVQQRHAVSGAQFPRGSEQPGARGAVVEGADQQVQGHVGRLCLAYQPFQAAELQGVDAQLRLVVNFVAGVQVARQRREALVAVRREQHVAQVHHQLGVVAVHLRQQAQGLQFVGEGQVHVAHRRVAGVLPDHAQGGGVVRAFLQVVVLRGELVQDQLRLVVAHGHSEARAGLDDAAAHLAGVVAAQAQALFQDGRGVVVLGAGGAEDQDVVPEAPAQVFIREGLAAARRPAQAGERQAGGEVGQRSEGQEQGDFQQVLLHGSEAFVNE